MRTLGWLLLPFVLVAGAAIGYFVRAEKPKTVTVVQIQTQAPLPPATHRLTALIQGPNDGCISASRHSGITSDTLTLRRPGNGLTDGEVIGVADSGAMDNSSCNYDIVFSISPSLGFFVVSDDIQGVTWGPFDSHKMAQRGWAVRLTDN
jgi:hypothetical protein